MRKTLSFLVFLSLLAVSFQWSYASPNPDSWANWKDAKNHFDAGQLNEAITELLAHPNSLDSSYYYNLGTTYYRVGSLGLAVAHLEKANRLQPHQPDIQTNLNIARQALSDKLGSEKLDPASFWIEQLADQVSFEEARATLGFLCLALVLIWIRSYSKTRQLRTTLLQPASYWGLAALAITFGMYSIRLWANSHPCGVLLEKQTVRVGPGDHFQPLEEVEPGSKVRVLGPATPSEGLPDDWNQVRYSADGIGWVRAKSLLIL